MQMIPLSSHPLFYARDSGIHSAKGEDSTDCDDAEDEFETLLVEEIEDFYGLERLFSEKNLMTVSVF